MLDRAPRRCADEAMVPRDVAGDSAHRGTFETSFRIADGWHSECGKSNCESE